MMELRTGTNIWIAAGVTDMRRGFYGLSAQVQTVLNAQPYSAMSLSFAVARRSGEAIVVRRRRALPVCQAIGARTFCVAEGGERSRRVEPRAVVDVLEGIDWRRPERTFAPPMAV